MNTLIENWFFLLVLLLCVGMHVFGHGHGHSHGDGREPHRGDPGEREGRGEQAGPGSPVERP